MIFFTSDNHFGHQNVIKYCNRPFSSVEEMNEKMVENWNQVVTKNDTVYHLGDFSLGFSYVEQYTPRLNGIKFLVPGNHDHCHSFHKKSKNPENRKLWLKKYLDVGWYVLPEIFPWVFNPITTKDLVLCHHPIQYEVGMSGKTDKYAKWRPEEFGGILLHGHVHETFKTKLSPKGTLQINVGVDVWDFKPVSIQQIVDEQEKA